MKQHILKVAAILSFSVLATGCDQLADIAKEEAKSVISDKKNELIENNQHIVDAAGAAMNSDIVGAATSTLQEKTSELAPYLTDEGQEAIQSLIDDKAQKAQDFVDSGIINEHSESFKERVLEKKAGFLEKASDKLSELNSQ